VYEGKVVACKIVPMSGVFREVGALTVVSHHPHVVHLIACLSNHPKQGFCAIILEKCDYSLDDLLANSIRVQLPWMQCLRYFWHVCLALAYLHEKSMLSYVANALYSSDVIYACF
jgi:serine/threonine protein kinase